MDKPHQTGSEIHYNPPTHFIKGDYGKIWKLQTETKEFIYYLQTSKDPQTPSWQRLGTIMEKSFVDLFENERFIIQCLKMYEYQTEHLGELNKMFNL